METSEPQFGDELDLLMSMYPNDIAFNSRTSELSYKHQDGRLCLRITSEYPSKLGPELITAFGPSKYDLRDKMSSIIQAEPLGEPCLDAIISEFGSLMQSLKLEKEQEKSLENGSTRLTEQTSKTVIIWLHHLLATSKRKQAKSPEGHLASHITGITKPGYPGVLIFSGAAEAVNTHVQTLKHLRWQAFQVRYEVDDRWHFSHGSGIVEVETMGEVVAELDAVGGGKEAFMEAMKMK